MTEHSQPVIRPTDERIPAYKEQAFPALGGLTKRELFAAMAMQGLVANDGNQSIWIVADQAIKQADALLKELAK